LSPSVGAEIKKKRPALIINDDAIGILPLRVIVPVTEWKKNFYGAVWMVKIDPNALNNLKKTSAIDCFQIRSISTKRFLTKICEVSPKILNDIDQVFSDSSSRGSGGGGGTYFTQAIQA
jgi:mRNA interferase MazF